MKKKRRNEENTEGYDWSVVASSIFSPRPHKFTAALLLLLLANVKLFFSVLHFDFLFVVETIPVSHTNPLIIQQRESNVKARDESGFGLCMCARFYSVSLFFNISFKLFLLLLLYHLYFIYIHFIFFYAFFVALLFFVVSSKVR